MKLKAKVTFVQVSSLKCKRFSSLENSKKAIRKTHRLLLKKSFKILKQQLHYYTYLSGWYITNTIAKMLDGCCWDQSKGKQKEGTFQSHFARLYPLTFTNQSSRTLISWSEERWTKSLYGCSCHLLLEFAATEVFVTWPRKIWDR